MIFGKRLAPAFLTPGFQNGIKQCCAFILDDHGGHISSMGYNRGQPHVWCGEGCGEILDNAGELQPPAWAWWQAESKGPGAS
jgi:hypothetical protein